MMVKLSVIMSVHNGQEYLRDAIDSILGQTYKDFELVVANDGSNDGTAGILEEYCCKDGRIKVITQERIGLTSSLNKMIGISEGEVIARHDADDISHPERFSRQMAVIDGDPDLMLVGTGAYYVSDKGVIIGEEKVPADPGVIKSRIIKRNCFFHGSVMMRKSCLKVLGGYHEEFRFAQDYDLFLRIAGKYKTANLPEPLYYYRMHAKSISGNKAYEQKKSALIAQKAATSTVKSGNLAWSRDVYDRIDRKLSWPYYRRLIKSDMFLDEAKCYLMVGERKMAVGSVWRAFVTFPRPRSIYNLIKVLGGGGGA